MTRDPSARPVPHGGAARTAASWALVAAAFSVSLGWALYRIRFGVDFTDEGLYLAAPMRYALGDLPFRDEITNPSRAFDVLLAPLFVWFPDLSIHQLRLLWVFVQFAAMLALFGLLRRWAPDVLVALAGASTMWLQNMIWTPGYHGMSAVFFTLSWSLWLNACLFRSLRAARWQGVASGVVFLLAVVSYLPLLALLAVPGVVWAVALARGRRSTVRAAATSHHLAGFAVPLLLLVGALAAAGLVGDWIGAQRDLTSLDRYAKPLSAKFGIFADQTLRFLPVLAGSALTVAAMGTALRARAVWERVGKVGRPVLGVALVAASALVAGRLLTVPVAPATTVLLDLWWARTSARVFAIALGFHLGALALLAWHRAWADRPRLGFVYSALFTGTLVFSFLHGFLGGQAFKVMLGMLPLAVSAVVIVYQACTAAAVAPSPRPLGAAFALVCCLCLGVGSLGARHQWVYNVGNMSQLTAEFRHPRLAGIRFHPDQVENIEALLAYLEERVRPGDFLIAYDDVPLLYYLTSTRPAIDHVWSSRIVPPGLRARSVERMIAAGRVPEYVVRKTSPHLRADAASPESVHPIDAFVWSRYEREATFPPFEVWHLRGESR